MDGKYIVHVKGAPDRMIAYCDTQANAGLLSTDKVEPIVRRYWKEQIAILSSHGLRVLALCRSTIDKSAVETGQQLGPEFVNGRDPVSYEKIWKNGILILFTSVSQLFHRCEKWY